MRIHHLLLLGLSMTSVTSLHAQTGGLDQAEAIGNYLNGALPSETPRPSSGSWTLTNAFPNLTVIDPVEMLPVPFSNRLMVVEKSGASGCL
ncbi:MAG: hypothetical protein P1U87_02440 [Verrucomicrobiales bacterium]|nr:hypothetical protein [Verrucomicrobiales bacterium]